MRRIPLFGRLEIETISSCNRSCETCLRNSYPDRTRVRSWFSETLLPSDVVYRVIDEAHALGYSGDVNLQHYNEPLRDERIVEFGRYVLSKGRRVGICTNGDYITPRNAGELDGAFSWMDVALYMDEPLRTRRQELLAGLFSETRLRFTGGVHLTNHFSPRAERDELLARNAETPCFLPWWRMIVDHRGEMLLCCDDMPGHFALGNVFERSVEELWFGERHQEILWALARKGGRRRFAHCSSCPREGGRRPVALRGLSGTGWALRSWVGSGSLRRRASRGGTRGADPVSP